MGAVITGSAREKRRLIDNLIESGEGPSKLLAREIEAHLGIEVDAQRLEAFIRERWDSIEHLAHCIHDPRHRHYGRR